MVWSLSQDDDGLESVSPNAVPPPAAGRPVSPPRPAAPASAVPVGGGGAARAAGSPKRSYEPTLVLAERRLDRLRAEVKRRQRLFFLRRQGALLGWMLAGGAAVAVGVLGARSLRSAGESSAGAAAPPATPVVEAAPVRAAESGGLPAEAPEEVRAVVGPAAADAPKPEASGANGDSISLDEIPTRSAVEKPRRVVERPER